MRASRNTSEEKAVTLKAQAEKLLEQEKLLASAQNIDSIRGVEGAAASIYFRAFASMLKTSDPEMAFDKRSRRPPENRVNALLSFTYMLLKNDMQSALESVGIDPAAGYLHTLRPGRPSMALDLMEELRSPLCDRFVISLVNLKQITASDFDTEGIELHSLMIRFQHAFLYRVQSAWAAFTTLSWKTVHLHIREIICIVPVC